MIRLILHSLLKFMIRCGSELEYIIPQYTLIGVIFKATKFMRSPAPSVLHLICNPRVL